MQKAVPWGRIRATDVKEDLGMPPLFQRWRNGQIKGVGDADKCTRIGSIKKWLVSMLGFLLGGCGKDVWGM